MNVILKGVLEKRYIRRDWKGVCEESCGKEEEGDAGSTGGEDVILIERALSQAMILGKYIKSVEICKREWEGVIREYDDRKVIFDGSGVD